LCHQRQFLHAAREQLVIPHSRAAVLAVLSVLVLSARASDWKIARSKQLPAELRWAQDIRWSTESAALLTAGKNGVFEWNFSAAPRRIVAGGGSEGFWFSSRLAATPKHLVVAAPLNSLMWWDRTTNRKLAEKAFSILMDVDMHGDRVAILGADYDPKGRFAPEGAIVWNATLRDRAVHFEPLILGKDGPGAKSMAQCHYLELGAIRFSRDGRLFVIPGIEPGLFEYDAKGRLLHTWPTQALGIVDRCSINEKQFQSMSAFSQPRWAWLAARRTVDEMVILPSGPALLVRSVDMSKNTSWDLVEYVENQRTRTTRLPISSKSSLSHLRADVDGKGRLLVLRLEYGELNEPAAAPPTLYVLER
jgi:hypothetical protein